MELGDVLLRNPLVGLPFFGTGFSYCLSSLVSDIKAENNKIRSGESTAGRIPYHRLNPMGKVTAHPVSAHN